jgi:hypothetical protein
LPAVFEQLPLKIVGSPKALGAKVTLYEVAPGDTVMLTELLQMRRDAMVAIGATPGAQQSAQKSAAAARSSTDPAVVSAADSQRSATRSPMAMPTISPSRGLAEVANGMTTITWVDATTGNTLKLSGRMPEERLRQVKSRIDQERASAAAKKNP